MEYVGWSLVIIGCVFNIISSIGCIKMPDIYTKLQAASISDSCGSPMALLGVALINGVNLVSLKILLLCILLLIITPTATNALINVAIADRVKPIGEIKTSTLLKKIDK